MRSGHTCAQTLQSVACGGVTTAVPVRVTQCSQRVGPQVQLGDEATPRIVVHCRWVALTIAGHQFQGALLTRDLAHGGRGSKLYTSVSFTVEEIGMSAFTLVSFDACPFVQRAAIMLQEQGREYDLRYVDLQNKPDWFLEISPNGKVPVLKVGDRTIFESAVILEYLDETAVEGRLLPDNPLERAEHRMWISYISNNIMSKGWGLQTSKDEDAVRARVAELRGHFEDLAKNMPGGGPLWGGENFTMVDAAIAPILQRFAWAEALEPTLGLFAGLPKIEAWRDALLARPSTTDSIVPDLQQRVGRMLHRLGSWVARGVGS